MGQVTIYLDDETEKKMVESARSMHVSKSKWIASVIREKLVDDWPVSVRELPGSWKGFPLAEGLRGNLPPDLDRDPI